MAYRTAWIAAALVLACAIATAGPAGAAAKSHAKGGGHGSHASGSRASKSRANGPFDARDPKFVFQVLTAHGVTAAWKGDANDIDYIDATAGQLSFQVDFYRCNPGRSRCGAVVYQVGWDKALVTLDQINRWNRAVLLCPAYLTEAGHPHAWLGVLPSVHDTREDVTAQQVSWLTCLTSFDQFTNDPEAFLKAQAK